MDAYSSKNWLLLNLVITHLYFLDTLHTSFAKFSAEIVTEYAILD